jgi:hypothetical protein
MKERMRFLPSIERNFSAYGDAAGSPKSYFV